MGQPVLAGGLPDRRDRARFARRPSARATTPRPNRRSARCSRRRAPGSRQQRAGGRDHAGPDVRRRRPTWAPHARGWVTRQRSPAGATTAPRPPASSSTTSALAAHGGSGASLQPAMPRGGHRPQLPRQERLYGAELTGRTPDARGRCCWTAIGSRRADSGADVHDGVVTVRRPAPLLARVAAEQTDP